MSLKPDIEAEVTIFPPEMSVRSSALRYDILGYFECPIEFSNGTWECRIVFPDADGQVELGQTVTAMIQFLKPREVLPSLDVGDMFQLLGENGSIARGAITRFITTTIKHELKLEFTGSSREYFRIWAVNLCLTLLTAGIFSAWAKVRKKRYFYSHTLLDGTPFQYLGQPLPILKGRIIGATLFAVYYVSRHFFTALLPYVFTLGAVLAPWVIVRSAAFKARYSAFRNMTFTFSGSYLDAFKVVHAWGIIPAVTACTICNRWLENWFLGIMYLIAVLLFPWWLNRLKCFLVGHTEYGGKNGELFSTGWQFFSIYFWAGLFFALVIIAGGLSVSIFHISKNSTYYAVLFSLPVYTGYALAYAYIQAHSGNLVWDETTLEPLRFHSTLCGSSLAKYYLTNALGIIVSAGLLTPWAVMRTMKYRVESLRIYVAGELTEFRGSENSSVSAAGAELGEFFDMDLSL